MAMLRFLETKREIVTLAMPALLTLLLRVALNSPLWAIIVVAVSSVVFQNLLVIWLRALITPRQSEQISGGD